MRTPLITHRRVLAVTVIALLVLSVSPARWVRPIVSLPTGALNFLLAPFTDRLHALGVLVRGRPASSVGNPDEAIRDRDYQEALKAMEALREENRRLREENAMLLQARQARQDRMPDRLLTASVVRTAQPAAGGVVTINRGARDGVVPGLVVTHGANLLGQVVSVDPVTATVRLITAPRTLIDVRIKPPLPRIGPREVLTQLEPASDGERLVATVEKAAPVAEGDLAHVVDRHLLEAEGFIVGRVVKVEPLPENPTLQNRVWIEPIVPVNALSRVVVLLPGEQGG